MLLNNHDAICNVDLSMKNCLSCALHFVPGGNIFAPLISHLPQKFTLDIAQFLKSRKNIPYVSPAFQTPLGIAHKQAQLKTLQALHVNIIAPSHAIASALKRNGIADDKITVIPHGITPLKQEPLELGLPDRPVRFGYVGRVAYAKGLHVLISALKLLSTNDGYELHIYGEGANKSEKRYATGLQKDTQDMPVFWHGKIDNTQVQKAYHSFDVMVHPTICLEVFGLTLLESLSSGRAVIATRCGGPEDFIEDGVDGFLVAPNDADQLAQAIKKFLDEPSLVEKMAKTIKPINTLENHTTDLEKLYKQVGLEE
jgi:glycosyltransferase involved in cell wall biosynthesis